MSTPSGDGYNACAEGYGRRAQPINDLGLGADDRALTRDEQHSGLVALVLRTTDNWPRTWRLVVLLAVVASLFGGLLWFVPFELVAGPISLIPK